MPIIPFLARAGSFLFKRGASIAAQKGLSAISSLTRPQQPTPEQTEQQKKLALHQIFDVPHHTRDDSFWISVFTVLAIPILLLYALFDLVLKSNSWTSGLY